MATTYEAIANVTVGSGGAANIEFTSIPATYTDLVLQLSLRTDRANNVDDATIQFNNSGGTAYSHRYLLGNGSSASSAAETSQSLINQYGSAAGNVTTSGNASVWGVSTIYIPNYAGSTAKSLSADNAREANQATDTYLVLDAGLWNNTAAITSIKLAPRAGSNFVQHSSAYLYGIKNS
jgi:hypothetical protein